MEGLSFRESSIQDKEAILNILPGAECYRGLDYLPHDFDNIFSRKTNTGYICEFENETVGFVLIGLVDNGETMLERALRVKVSLQGRGVNKQLCAFARQGFLAKHNQIKRERMTILETIYSMHRESLHKTGYRDLMSTRIAGIYTDKKKILNSVITSEEMTNSICEITVQELGDVFSNINLSDKMFPDRMLHVHVGQMVMLNTSNLDFLADHQPFILLDTRCLSTETDAPTELNEENADTLTIGILKKCFIGWNHIIYVNGMGTSLREHLLCHLRYLSKQSIDDTSLVNISVFVDPSDIRDFIVERFLNLAQDLGLVRSSDFSEEIVYCLEREQNNAV